MDRQIEAAKPQANQVQAWARGTFSNAIVGVVIAAIQLFLCAHALSVLLESPKDLRKGRLPYLLLGLAIFTFSGIGASVDTYNVFRVLWFTTDAPGSTYLELIYASVYEWPARLNAVCVILVKLSSDAILLYRSYLLWGDSLWVLVVPGLCSIATFGLGIHTVIEPAYWDESAIDLSVRRTLAVTGPIVNVIVTALISVKLLKGRREGSLSLQNFRIYDQLVILLIESALPAAVFGVAYAISVLVYLKRSEVEIHDYAVWITGVLYLSAVALAPQLIIFRVTLGRSFKNALEATSNAWGIDPEVASRMDHSLKFAHTRDIKRTDRSDIEEVYSEESVGGMDEDRERGVVEKPRRSL